MAQCKEICDKLHTRVGHWQSLLSHQISPPVEDNVRSSQTAPLLNLPFCWDITKPGNSALLWNGGEQNKNPETLSTGKSKELQQHKTRCKEESLWKCMRCEKLTGQLKVLKYNQIMPLPCPIVLHPPFVPSPQHPSIRPAHPPTSDYRTHYRPTTARPVSLHKLPGFHVSWASWWHFCSLCAAPEGGTWIPRACRELGLRDPSVNTTLICLRY